MNTREFYKIFIDGIWIEDLDTKKEVKEKIENWIEHTEYLEDELLDLCFESDVSTITVEFAVKKVFK